MRCSSVLQQCVAAVCCSSVLQQCVAAGDVLQQCVAVGDVLRQCIAAVYYSSVLQKGICCSNVLQ